MKRIKKTRFIAMLACLFACAFGFSVANAQSFGYVANSGSSSVSVIDTVSNTVVATIPVGSSPQGVAITPNGAFVYVANSGSNNVSVIATASNAVVTAIPVTGFPTGVAITPDGAFAYVTDQLSASVSVIATVSNTVVTTFVVGNFPLFVAITPDGAFAYVTTYGDNTVKVIATASNAVVASIPVGVTPVGIAITPNGAFAYVGNQDSFDASVIQTSSNTVIATVPTGLNPQGAGIRPDGAFAYVMNSVSNTISVIATASNTVVATIPVTTPRHVAFTPNGRFGYVTNTASATVSVFDTVSNAVVATIPVGIGPLGIDITPLVQADAPINATGTKFGATEGVSFTGTVATFTDQDPGSTATEYSATIDWGDNTSTTAGTISGPIGGPFTVTGTHTYGEQGTYSVTVTISDVDNPKNNATAVSTANVGDGKLSSTCATMPVSTQIYSGPTAIFTDQSSTGTLSDFSATIDWGDNTTSAGTIAGGPGNVPYTVSGTHTYASTGTFLISTLISDVGGSSTTTPACSVIVFAFPTATGAFVIGDLADPPPIVGDSVTWWSSQWAQLNPMSGGPAPASMKGFSGFEDNLLGVSRTCGSSWTTDTGNATPPPPSVPPFMGVLVSSRITQNGSVITGDIKQVVVVHNNPGYAPNPGNPGTGTVVAVVCGP